MGKVIAEQTLSGYLLANSDLMLRIDTRDHPFLEEYFAKDAHGRWCKLLAGGNCGEGGASVVVQLNSMIASLAPERVQVHSDSGGRAVLEIDFAVDEIRIHEQISLGAADEFFAFQVRVTQAREDGPQYVINQFCFEPQGEITGRTDFTWTPALRPEPGDVIADHALRSPALIIHKEPCSAILIPDVSQIGADQTAKTSADLDRDQQETPILSYGLRNWSARGHTFYEHKPSLTLPASREPLGYGLMLHLSCRTAKESLLTETSGFLWRYVARTSLRSIKLSDPRFVEGQCEMAWSDATTLWIPMPGEAEPRGGINTNRLHWANGTENDGDVWFDCWMQSLHTALGLYLYGREKKRRDYMDKAVATLNLALSAPQHDGIFPTIAYLEKGTGQLAWIPDSGWAGFPEQFHAMDCSFTGYWMLRFADELPDCRDKVLSFCTRYGEFLLDQQKQDGLIPCWFDRTLQPKEDLLYDVNAETGTSALFLIALANATRQERYVEAAKRALDFIARRVIPTGLWFDHETFYACSDKEFDFWDHHTNQPPQSTLSMIHTAMAYCELTRTLKTYKPLEHGIRVLSLLAMYQQLWNPPYFSIPTFGGFGVQNTDAEWSDARQAYCADLFYSYFAITGNEEYRQRALAALYAALLTAPHENWAHDLTDEGGAADCFHWGQGSAAAAAAILADTYGRDALLL